MTEDNVVYLLQQFGHYQWKDYLINHFAMRKILLIGLILIFSTSMTQGQVLLSILFGDDLNTPKLEFGLNAGFNLSYIRGIDGSKAQNNWELGFYFDYWLKENSPWYLATGVYVKSNVGGTNIPLDYEGNRVISEDVYEEFVKFGGRVEKQFNTFYVPINLRYMTNSGFFFDAGVQIGLVFKTRDLYQAEVDGSNLEYQVVKGVKDNGLYKWFDGGNIKSIDGTVDTVSFFYA